MENQDATPEMLAADLEALKDTATTLGIDFHPSIGAEKLRKKIAEHKTTPEETPAAEAPSVIPKPVPAPFDPFVAKEAEPVAKAEETVVEKRSRLKSEAMKLVRIRLTCMNPAKKEWDGEIITVGNGLVGTVKKFIPFNNEEGWHVPQIMFNMLKSRECQIFVEVKDAKGNKSRKGKIIREFAIEILDPLTKQELAELAARQAASRSID